MSKTPNTFTLTIVLGNDAMQTPEDVAELLAAISKDMYKNGSWPRERWRDINGHTVGIISVL
jgi:hypothetical protein